jgi:hypothetical protein
MAAARRILCEKDIAGADREVFALAGLEVERSAERNNKLQSWRIMPGKRATGLSLLERDARGTGLTAQQVTTCAFGKVDRPVLEAGIAIVAGPYPHASNHFLLPL